MEYDELELDSLGEEKTALFVIISDTDATFNFVVSISLWLIKGNKKKGKAQSRRYQRQDTRINCDYTRLVL